ncbi:MAG: hypothetical protein HFJ41_01120 [Clostridia bacterium]|nr:hypothetical protein [Clostridia bacterium]
MRKKDFLFNFLMFSMLILIILIVMLIFKEYGNKYEISKSQYNKRASIESSLVRNDSNNTKEQERHNELSNQTIQKEEQEEVERQMTEEIAELSPKELIVNYADYDKNFVNAVIRQLSYIPSKILNDFDNKGWKICIVSEEEIYNIVGQHQLQMYSVDKNQFIKGYTKIKDKTIYLVYNSMTIKDNTIIHEVGHQFDIVNGWPSCTLEYGNIYDKEKNSLNSKTTCISSNQELFAETFEYVILEEEVYEELETYQYVKDIIYHN